jgi:hypothetical protein
MATIAQLGWVFVTLHKCMTGAAQLKKLRCTTCMHAIFALYSARFSVYLIARGTAPYADTGQSSHGPTVGHGGPRFSVAVARSRQMRSGTIGFLKTAASCLAPAKHEDAEWARHLHQYRSATGLVNIIQDFNR